MSECDECGGMLECPVGQGERIGLRYAPCPECLTTPATDEIREVAREWLGFDVWDQLDHVNIRRSASPWSVRVEGFYRRALPLYLPAGRDLSERCVAKMLQESPRKPHGVAGPSLHKVRVAVAGGWTNVRVLLASHGYEAPESWAVTADAPRDLQAARWLALCLAAWSRPCYAADQRGVDNEDM